MHTCIALLTSGAKCMPHTCMPSYACKLGGHFGDQNTQVTSRACIATQVGSTHMHCNSKVVLDACHIHVCHIHACHMHVCKGGGHFVNRKSLHAHIRTLYCIVLHCYTLGLPNLTTYILGMGLGSLHFGSLRFFFLSQAVPPGTRVPYRNYYQFTTKLGF